MHISTYGFLYLQVIYICFKLAQSQPELSYASHFFFFFFGDWQSNVTNETITCRQDGLISALLYATLLLLPLTRRNFWPGHIKYRPMMLGLHFWLFLQSLSDVDLNMGSEALSALPMHDAPSARWTVRWSLDSDKCPSPLVTCTDSLRMRRKKKPFSLAYS